MSALHTDNQLLSENAQRRYREPDPPFRISWICPCCGCSKYLPETRAHLPDDKLVTVHVVTELDASVPLSKPTTAVAAVVSASPGNSRFGVLETEPEKSGIWGGISKLLCRLFSSLP